MKNVILLSFAFSIAIITTYAQPFNNESIQEGKSPMLLGKINKQALSENTYSEWFLTNYKAYQPDKEKISEIEKLLPQYTITAFFGSWCGDSKKELPVFYKVLDEANFPLERLTVVAVDSDRNFYKQSPGGEQEGLNIHRVPTFIFYKNGQEVNRIVEHPVTTFEDDIVQIIQTKAYTPNYNAVTIVNDALNEMGIQKFQKKMKKLMPQLKEEAKSLGELNTYSNVLFYSSRKEEAITVAALNTFLFPKEAYVYESLANKFYDLNQFDKALENYNKALVLKPDNKRVKVSIESTLEKIND
ncbi:thioredoxin family protein [Aequorivita sp. Q41]|uniref:tetratricopeptide repeat protein n=1 Tax=Aequorivita sp. Q41 TaxID=3153300 RepID=UPI0032424BEB